MTTNKLILGDNLKILKKIESETVALIYLDPPFFSNKNYEVIWGDAGEIRSFEDRWSGGMDQYITWLRPRIEESYRILKKTGSLFVHCDWHADAYIRTLILDPLFGEKNFRNHIIWCYTGPSSGRIRQFNRKHDSIFWYSRGSTWVFNPESVLISYKDGSPHSGGFLEKSGNTLNPKLYTKGKIPETWWVDIAIAARSKKEWMGYPTQKPEKLLERIIKCASNEQDVVVDPFVGGGTTVAVANILARRWIGIDQSAAAIKVSQNRLQKQNAEYILLGAPHTQTVEVSSSLKN
ncbi:putative adenine-specific DNA-methyltransferase [Pillotina sp. SPG140]|jgi:DNA modification methylase